MTGTSSSCGHSWSPSPTLTGSLVTVWVMALVRSTRPAPCSYAVSAGFGLAEATSAALTRAPVQSGCCCLISAAEPATCGVAIEVPDSDTYPSPAGVPMTPVEDFAATMSTPGAVMSGLTAPSPVRGPRLENTARLSSRSTAPTVSAASALPGEPTVSAAPELPAAITNSVPYWAESVFTASSSGSTSGVSPPPRLRFATSAPCSAAHTIPLRIHDSAQP